MVDDGKEPSRPGERFGVVALKELAVEIVDKTFHGFFWLDVVLMAPTQKRPRLARDFAFHLLFGGFRDVDVVTMAFEAYRVVTQHRRLKFGLNAKQRRLIRQPYKPVFMGDGQMSRLFVVGIASCPGDLLGEGGCIGVFVILDGG